MIDIIKSIFKDYNFLEYTDFEHINMFDAVFKSSDEVYLIKMFKAVPDINEVENLQSEYIYAHLIKMSNESI